MDKIELDRKDLDALLAWRDENKELVRSMPAPLGAIEIVMKHNYFRIKGIRKGRTLQLHLADRTKTLCNVEFFINEHNVLEIKKGKNKLDRDSFQSVLTVYCSLMALIAYSRPMIVEDTATTPHKPHQRRENNSPKKAKSHTTYIIRTLNGRVLAAPVGSHASPSYAFSVRGHYRHYKSGKVVWIEQYKKGDGKKKNKLYKMGGGSNA